MSESATIQLLREVIAALDRRRPQLHRAGEVAIARDAAALKARARRRIAEIERGQTSAEPGTQTTR